MQFALDQDQQRKQLLQHEADQLDKVVVSIGDKLQALDEELDICIAADKDDLARDLVHRKLAAKKQLQATRDRSAAINLQGQTLSRQIDEQTQQLTSMKQKLELLVKIDDSSVDAGFTTVEAIRSEEIEIALLREKQKRTQS
jgi:hypothetical protein